MRIRLSRARIVAILLIIGSYIYIMSTVWQWDSETKRTVDSEIKPMYGSQRGSIQDGISDKEKKVIQYDNKNTKVESDSMNLIRGARQVNADNDTNSQVTVRNNNSMSNQMKNIPNIQTDCSNVTMPVPANITIHNEAWQTLMGENVEIYLYRAIFDNRPAGGAMPTLRILAVGREVSTLYCQVWYSGLSNPVVKKAKIIKHGGNSRIGSFTYCQYFFNCQLDYLDVIPSHVGLVLQRCDQSQNLLPVFNPGPRGTRWQHEFGVCVPISFWHVDPYRVVEWVEMNRHLGVTEINVYALNMTEQALTPLKYYQKEGIVKLFMIPSPKHARNRNGVKLPSPLSINDCIWRNMYRYKYALVIDFDEVIVPRSGARNYTQLIQQIDKAHHVTDAPTSYTFRNTYYWVSCGRQLDHPAHSYIFRFLRREEHNKPYYGVKSMIDPRQCLSAFNHYCWIRFSHYPYKLIDVSADLGLSHHYREAHKGQSGCKNIESKMYNDSYMLRYEGVVQPVVNKQLINMGLQTD